MKTIFNHHWKLSTNLFWKINDGYDCQEKLLSTDQYTIKILQCIYSFFRLLLICYSERLFPQFTVNWCYFFTFIFVKYCVFYSVKCKMLRHIVKNIVKYRDFFNRQIGASILLTKYRKFCHIFTGNCIFLNTNCKTNKIQLFVKMFTI